MKVFLDMDGVLCDFTGAALKLHGKSIPPSEVRWNFHRQVGLTDAEFWAPLGPDFWASLPWTAEGKALLRRVEQHFGAENVALLTSPCATPGCIDGKCAWVRREMPDYLDRLIVTPAKHFLASLGDSLLIDDRDENLGAFVMAGGVALTIPRPWNRERQYCNDDGTFNLEPHVESALRYMARRARR